MKFICVIAICVLLIGYILLECAAKVNNTWPLPTWFTATKKEGNKPKLTIPSLINYGGNIVPMGAVTIPQIQMAVDAAQRAGILSDYDVSIRAYDDQCDHGAGVNMALRLMNAMNDESSQNDPSFYNLVPMTLGPICAYQLYVANLYQYYNFVLIADVAAVMEMFHDRKRYEAVFVMYPSFEVFYEAIPAFIASNGWKNVHLMTETYPFWIPLEEHLVKYLALMNLTLTSVSKVITLPGVVPDPELFETATAELAAHDPHIVIVNSVFGGLLACWLHRQGLYGPKYVFIMGSFGNFLPNSPLRALAPWCTERMLLEIIQSVIPFVFGYPLDMNPNAIDSVGTRGQDFLDILKAEVDHPELSESWLFYKGLMYDQTIAGLLMLDSVDKELKRSNDSLINWVTSSLNFQMNGSYLYSLMKQKAKDLHYNGTCAVASVGVNSLRGITAFHQYQLNSGEPIVGDLTAAVKSVPVASYDTTLANPVVQKEAYPVKWRTPDGLPPYDTLRLFQLVEPVIPNVTKIILQVLAALMLSANMVIFVLNSYKAIKYQKLERSIRIVNSIYPFGNSLLTCFVLIMPVDVSSVDSKRCMTSVMFLIVGFALIVMGMHVKFKIAYLLAQAKSTRGTNKATSRAVGPSSSKQGTDASSTTTEPLTIQQFQLSVCPPNPQSNTEYAKEAETFPSRNIEISFAIVWYFLQLLLTIVWFITEPLTVTDVDRQLDIPNKDVSIAYQHSTKACNVGSNASIGFIGTLLTCYSISALRTLYLAYLLRKSTRKHFIDDLQEMRMTAYAKTLLTASGSIVIGAFFRSNPGAMHTATCTLVLLVVATVTTTIFIMKVRNGF